MNKIFNGQINISRDLRQNKNVIIGRYDLTDIIFLFLGFSVAFIVAYGLGFSTFHIVDEFTAVIIAIFPMLIIISFGFKRIAGIRQFNYLIMKSIDKKSRVRFNRIFDKTQTGEKFIAGFLVDRKYVYKYINKFLSYENTSLLSVRFTKDINTNKNNIYFLLDLRYKNYDDIFIDLFDKFSFNKEIVGLSYEDINNLQKDIDLRFQDKNYKIYMLNIYDIKVYKKFINTVKRYCDVICYFKKDGKKKFVNTFLLIEDETKKGKKLTKLEKIYNLCTDFGIIVDKLTNEQAAGKEAVSYFMTNPFNNYRIYR